MKVLCVLVHVPVAPHYYPFSKIGYYPKYYNIQVQKKAVDKVLRQLNYLVKNKNNLGKYDEVKPLLSSYFIRLCPRVFTVIKDVTYEQIKWEYFLSKSMRGPDNDNQAYLDLPKGLNNADFTTIQAFMDHEKEPETIDTSVFREVSLNHLQLDVLQQLAELKMKHGNEVFAEKENAWFLQAEHLLWMSHNKDYFIFNSPFLNAYDAYINYMNMLSDLKARW